MKASDRKTSAYDTQATIRRIEGNTAWVHIPGGVDETPVQMTINAKEGDQVQVRVSGGRAFLVGNATAPPTDDSYARQLNMSLSGDLQSTNRVLRGLGRIVETVKDIASNTNQYFWHTEEGEDTGAHITEIPQDEFLADPEHGGGNLLARSNGVAVRDGLDELSIFSSDGVRIGKASEGHMEVLQENGWLDNNRRFVIMDANPANNKNLTVDNYNNITNNIVGEHLFDFDSCLVLAHFKGHAMGGFGGALKQLSIGFASKEGKANIHSGGFTVDANKTWDNKAEQLDFTAAMADAASTIVHYFRNKSGIVFINVLANISTRCDCGTGAPEPRIKDIGILASTDPVAIDKACYDLIVEKDTEGSNDWKKKADDKLALHTVEVAEKLGIGTQDYILIKVDNDLQYVWYIIIPLGSLIIIGVAAFFIVKAYKKRKKVRLIEENGGLGSAVISRVE